MEETPAVVVSPPTPPAKFPLWNVIIIILVLLVLCVSVFIAYQLGSSQQKVVAPTQSPSPAASPTPAPTQKRIVYSKDNALWIINSDGTNRIQLVKPDIEGSYRAVAWKNADELSYVVCNPSCHILTIKSDKFSQTKEADPGESVGLIQISALAWNHAGNQLAYIYSLPDGKMQMDFKSGTVKNTVKKFAPAAGGRGGSLDDNVSVYFSPDDKHILVTDTGTQPNATDKNTVWVFESGGKEIISLKADAGWPTQARWADNNRFIYKKGDTVYSYYLDGTPSQKIMSQIFMYNPVPHGQQLYFWVNTDTLPYINPGKITPYYRPEILDSSHLVALKAKKAEGETLMIPFNTAGLSVIDLSTNKATDLDSGEVTLFSVSP